MGLSPSKQNVKYGSECYNVDLIFSMHVLFMYFALGLYVVAGGMYYMEYKPWFYVPLAIGILLMILYFRNVYKKHRNIVNSEKIECKDEYRKVSIWY